MNILFLLIWLGFITLVFFLSRAAYNGGFHTGSYRALKKCKSLNELIVKSGSIELLREWNNCLIELNVKNNKPSYLTWMFDHKKEMLYMEDDK